MQHPLYIFAANGMMLGLGFLPMCPHHHLHQLSLSLSRTSPATLVLYAMYCATNMADVTLAEMFAFLVCNEYACSYQDNNPSSMEWKFKKKNPWTCHMSLI